MSSKHIKRDYSAHRKDVIRPYDEFIGATIHSFDPNYVRTYLADENSVPSVENAVKGAWKSWTVYRCSFNNGSTMVFNLPYNVVKEGEYRIDILYEQSNHIASDNGLASTDYDTGDDLLGHVTISSDGYTVHDADYLFDGENNVTKRLSIYQELNQGIYNIRLEIPSNCYFMGCIVRKVITYTGNNYYGSNSGKDMGELVITGATITFSDMMKPSEAELKILFDDAFECYDSPSGFYLDYMDEVNITIKDNDGDLVQVFGGYISSILPNDNRTEITIHCADRLVDGQNKYILDELVLGGGTKAVSEDNYSASMRKSFDTYTQALKYLCDSYETTLQSNIKPNFLVDGEKYSKGFVITYGKNKTIKNIKTTNGESKAYNNYIMLRNKASGEKTQSWTLYDAKSVAKQAPNITNFGYMHITYGLGSPVTSHESKTTTKVDTSDYTAGVQSFGKCGQSKDGKYLMAIGKISGVKKTSLSKSTIYKTVFENKCPYCGGKLVWDSGRSDTDCVHCGKYKHSKREWGNISETEITCTKCCSDFDAVTGYEKISSPKKHIKKISSSVKSSKAEQDKLHKGKMKAVPKTGIEITPDDIFESITKLAKKYKYKRGTSSTWSSMKKTGNGDCHAFSELILDQLKKYGVSCKIVEYKTNASDSHRSVLYLNEKGKYVDFPYREYGWNKNLYNTSKSKNGRVVEKYSGHNIGSVKTGSKTTSKSQTTKITTTKNYDKDKPFQGYLKLTVSKSPSFDSKKQTLWMKFTHDLESSKWNGINDSFNVFWVNNTTKKITSKRNIVKFIQDTIYHSNDEVYLHNIQMITPIKQVTDSDKDTSWYKIDKQTIDESSCKMNLYQITFNDDKGTEPSELASCGKSVLSMMQELVKDTGYYVNMEYGEHRKDDIIHFRVDNSTNTSFVATEGDNNNILSWNSINYSPVSSMFNNSVQVYKSDNVTYKYITSRSPQSVLRYGEQTTLETTNSIIMDSEAYWNARMNEKFNDTQTYTFTITVPNYPNVRLGDLVEVIANAKKLNTVKQIKSLKIMFDKSKMPRIRTEIGLDELAPDIQLRENIRNLRRDAKKKTTSFSSSATPVNDIKIYQWDR